MDRFVGEGCIAGDELPDYGLAGGSDDLVVQSAKDFVFHLYDLVFEEASSKFHPYL